MKKQIFCCLLVSLLIASAKAQVSRTLSPYSQFGIGQLADQSQGFSRGMGGLSMGLRDGKLVNMLNPASYSAVDSLTMIFDMGFSGQVTNFSEGGKKMNGRTGSFDYAVASFRILPKVGFAFGVVPYSNVGYDYYKADYIGGSSDYINEIHSGSGGFNQAFVGMGWEFLKGFSAGFNLSYFWGDNDRVVSLVSNDSYVNTQTKTYSTSVSSYKLDFGFQWQGALSKMDVLTVGATLGVGHNLKEAATLVNTIVDSQTGESNNDTLRVADAYSLPLSLGVGATLLHNNRLTVGADYLFQRWGSLTYPVDNPSASDRSQRYTSKSGVLENRHKFIVGLDWIPNPSPRSKFFSRIHYRMGASYATPYYNIQGQKGPKELALTAGLAIPLINAWNNRSTLNISAQWARTSAPSFITENMFRINIGLTFNERWFAKWKVD